MAKKSNQKIDINFNKNEDSMKLMIADVKKKFETIMNKQDPLIN